MSERIGGGVDSFIYRNRPVQAERLPRRRPHKSVPWLGSMRESLEPLTNIAGHQGLRQRTRQRTITQKKKWKEAKIVMGRLSCSATAYGSGGGLRAESRAIRRKGIYQINTASSMYRKAWVQDIDSDSRSGRTQATELPMMRVQFVLRRRLRRGEGRRKKYVQQHLLSMLGAPMQWGRSGIRRRLMRHKGALRILRGAEGRTHDALVKEDREDRRRSRNTTRRTCTSTPCSRRQESVGSTKILA